MVPRKQPLSVNFASPIRSYMNWKRSCFIIKTLRNRRELHRRCKRRRGRLRRRKMEGGEDPISCLPDVILQHIFSFIPTKFAIRTSVLSKRWRHVWSDTPSLSLDCSTLMEAASIDETLTRYTAPKMMSFNLIHNVPHIDKFIEFVMSRHVENMSLSSCNDSYTFPDFFFVNSSVKQLTVLLNYTDMIPRCSVSWTSLRKLSLHGCNISDEAMAKILIGCPILESLTLYHCNILMFLDLSKSLRLRTLEVHRNAWISGPNEIVAPHIHCLRLTNSELPCTLIDVSSTTEANLNLCIPSWTISFEADFLQVMVLKMIEKLRHVEKLTFGGSFLHILSLAELLGVPFPMFKIKVLTLETEIVQYVIPGIERVLQNSPDLKWLRVITKSHCDTIPGELLDNYLVLQGLNPTQCWRSKEGVRWNKSHCDLKPKHLNSFVKLMMKNTKTLEKMFLLLEDRNQKFRKIAPILSRNNKISISFYSW